MGDPARRRVWRVCRVCFSPFLQTIFSLADIQETNPPNPPNPEPTNRTWTTTPPKRFLDRPPETLKLPRDSAEAEAAVAAFIRGDAEFWPRAELQAQRQRLQALRDPLAPDSLDVLARQLPTLESLWQRFALESVRAANPEHRLKYLKAALHAQQAHARTFALLRTLMHQQAGARATVTLIDGPDNDNDNDNEPDND